MRTIHILGILALLALAVSAAPVHAGGGVTVCDEAHLLAALAGGGTVTFACSGTITLAATIAIAADTTIDGSGQAVTISGDLGSYAVRVFTVNEGSTLNLNLVTVANGDAENGGGIYSDGGTVTVNNTTFSGNHAYYLGGGGIYSDGGTVTVNNSTFSGNSAVGWGGGISNFGGTLTVSNSTFSGNEASFPGGGGIFNWRGTATISNCTFSRNIAVGRGGGISNYDGTVTVSNSIFSGNGSNWAGSCEGPFIDGAGNLSYPDTTCPGINADPVLGPLQYNGGPTWTMALLPGSAAIDAGDNAICAADPVNNLDQRGVIRPQGLHCDIGAYERQQFLRWFPFARSE